MMKKQKPFNLQRALAGDPVVTRTGDPVTQIHKFDGLGKYKQRIYGVYDGHVESWEDNGRYADQEYFDDHESTLDIFMSSKTVERWVNVYKGTDGILRTDCEYLYDSHYEANCNFSFDEGEKYLGACKIEIEL